MALPTVAIAGATGNVGAKIAAVFLRPAFRPRFRDVVLLTRSTTSVAAQVIANGGATLRVYDEENLAAVLEDVDVVVNA
jgi:putative NADH-flavin reductase